jgi:hypothetical protein
MPDAALYSLCKFLLILPVPIKIESALMVKDQGPVFTRIPNHTAFPELCLPRTSFRQKKALSDLRIGEGMLRRKIKANVAFSRKPAHERSGQNKLPARTLGEFLHEPGEVKIEGRKETALMVKIQISH